MVSGLHHSHSHLGSEPRLPPTPQPQQRRTLNPLSEARDGTHILMDPSRVSYCWDTPGPPSAHLPVRCGVCFAVGLSRACTPSQSVCSRLVYQPLPPTSPEYTSRPTFLLWSGQRSTPHAVFSRCGTRGCLPGQLSQLMQVTGSGPVT